MEFDKEKRYYVYAWYIKETNEIFYIGKGTGNRYRTRKRENKYFMKVAGSHECVPRILYNNLDEKTAFEIEKREIAFFREFGHRPLTNVLDGGENPPKMTEPHSEEWKAHQREGLIRSFAEHPERRLEISTRMKKFFLTEEGKRFQERSKAARQTDAFRKRQSVICRASNRTKEYRERMSNYWKEYFKENGPYECMVGNNNHNAQKVLQLDKSESLIQEFPTMTEASKATGVSVSKISAVCRGERKTAGGYIWRFATSKRIKLSGAKRSKENPSCRKAVLQYTKNGELVAEHKSIMDAAESLGKDKANIIACLKGRIKSAYNYVWVYKQGNTVRS